MDTVQKQLIRSKLTSLIEFSDTCYTADEQYLLRDALKHFDELDATSIRSLDKGLVRQFETFLIEYLGYHDRIWQEKGELLNSVQ